MALTDDQRKTLLILEVGDTAGNLLAGNIDLLWEKYAPYAPVSADLRDLYVKIGLFDLRIAKAQDDTTFTDGDYSQSASHVAQRLLERQKAAIDAAELLSGESASANGVTGGQLTTVTPQSPPTAPLPRPYGPDATDPQYLGSPYYPRHGGRRW